MEKGTQGNGTRKSRQEQQNQDVAVLVLEKLGFKLKWARRYK